MKRFGKIEGVEGHRLFGRLLGACEAEVRSENDLRSWIFDSYAAPDARKWDGCRKTADEFFNSGVSVFTWRTPDGCRSLSGEKSGADLASPRPGVHFSACRSFACPSVLFGKGPINTDQPLLAVFNSRKPRLVSSDSKWVKALRFFFKSLEGGQIGVAGSTGTLTYDMAAALASRAGLPQLLVAPSPFHTFDPEGIPALSCTLDSVTCPKKERLICRDRIVAALANFHLLLEIRARGNLLAVLEDIQSRSPRRQFIFDPGTQDFSNAGNYALMGKFPEHASAFKLPPAPDTALSTSAGTLSPAPGYSRGRLRTKGSGSGAFYPRGKYLFHYTRACAGPWPGQTYRQYLLDLLDGCPLSGHSALETIIRILKEGTIRATDRMVRGREAVICWSSHPPQELFAMRRWNRTLARWTVEPYGIAVRRDILRSLGAKPAVYGGEHTYGRIPQSEKYRFQLSRSTPSASWRHEREWRLRGDLALSKLKPDEGFVFVQTEEEKAKLCSHVNPGLSIVGLDALL
jgi:hypothetical protein